MSHLTSEGMYRGGRFFRNPALIYAAEKGAITQEPDLTGSRIAEFFGGRTVFLTGATGFMGKVLMEKLLRSCPDLEEIIVICRQKKGKDMNTRMDDIFDDPLYSRLSKVDPKFRHKVTILAGDISKPGLGISEKDRKVITSKASVIIHSAATVRFDEHLKIAVETNLMGTQQMLQLASECSNLVSMVYISTAYSNCTIGTVEEKFYPAPIEPNELIDLVKSNTMDELDEITPSLLGPWPNTYTFTKAVTESMVKKEAGSLPLAIIRPSIIVSTYNEPIRGWIDNVYGPTGVVMGSGLGIIRALCCDSDNIADIIPVDLVANAIITVAHKQSITDFDEIPIYNYVSSPQSPITWGEFMTSNQYYGLQIPTMKSIWYYRLNLTKYVLLYKLQILLLHIIPAVIVDGAAIVLGKKPQLLKVYKKIHKFSSVISYFSLRNWMFSNTNMQLLWDDLTPEDRIAFPFDASEISWDHHAQMNTMGMRTYLIKEDPSTIPQAQAKFNKFWALDVILRGIFYFMVLRLVYELLTMVFSWV